MPTGDLLKRPYVARRSRRGLGLIDSMLALAVMIVLGATAGQIFAGWVERRISQAEGRVLSAWADAGTTWVLQNRDSSTGAGLSANSRDITADVAEPALWRDPRTPHRNRTIRLWVRSDGAHKAQLVAVASGVSDAVPVPVAGDGIATVGMVRVRGGSKRVIGPGIDFPLGSFADHAAQYDLVAVREVTTDQDDPYLHRRQVDGRPDLNTMETDLIMGDNAISDVGTVSADRIDTQRIDGPLTVSGGMTLQGAMRVERAPGVDGSAAAGGGTVDMPPATFTGDLKANTVTATGVDARTINARNARVGTLSVTGGCNGCQP